MKINRYSCKCKLCKAKWTTTETDRAKVGKQHGENCPKWQARLQRWIRPGMSESALLNEHYQISCSAMEMVQITGHYNAEVKCDARCMGATGHNCECSCGGKNHGVSAAA